MMSLFFIFMLIMLQIMVMSFHPILFNLILIFMALLISFMVFKINASWFFFLLMLVFLGGVMILIIYMNTLIMNEKIFLKKFFHLYMYMYFIITIFILKKNIFLKINNSNFYSMMIYENMNMFMMLFLMLYLLFTLICVVKLVKFEYGPLIKRL